MKLVSFRIATPVGPFTRVGALHGQSVVDLNMAYARWLADQREAQPHRLADAQVPSNMLEFLAGGLSTMAAARRAVDYAAMLGPSTKGPAGETIAYGAGDVRIIAPLARVLVAKAVIKDSDAPAAPASAGFAALPAQENTPVPVSRLHLR